MSKTVTGRYRRFGVVGGQRRNLVATKLLEKKCVGIPRCHPLLVPPSHARWLLAARRSRRFWRLCPGLAIGGGASQPQPLLQASSRSFTAQGPVTAQHNSTHEEKSERHGANKQLQGCACVAVSMLFKNQGRQRNRKGNTTVPCHNRRRVHRALQILRKASDLSDAPPTKNPSMSAWVASSLQLASVTEPP